MKRELVLALTGLSMLMPAIAEAQRPGRGGGRAQERGTRIEQPAPVRAPGRVYRTRPNRDVRARVVYSSRSRPPRYSVGHRWVRADFGVIRIGHRGGFVRGAVLDRSDLRHLLGRHTVNRVRDAARRAGIRGPMRGRWIATRGAGRVLVVTMDGFEVAEFADFDRDGFIDQVYLIGQRRPRRTVSRW